MVNGIKNITYLIEDELIDRLFNESQKTWEGYDFEAVSFIIFSYLIC